MKAITHVTVYLNNQRGGRGFVYRGVTLRHNFHWNQSSHRHELGPMTIAQFNSIKQDLLESPYSGVRANIEFLGEVEIDDDKAPKIESIVLAQHQKAKSVGISRPLVGNINPAFLPEVATESEVAAIRKSQEKPVDVRLDGEAVSVMQQPEPIVGSPDESIEPEPESDPASDAAKAAPKVKLTKAEKKAAKAAAKKAKAEKGN